MNVLINDVKISNYLYDKNTKTITFPEVFEKGTKITIDYAIEPVYNRAYRRKHKIK